jgi:hypothetical protein
LPFSEDHPNLGVCTFSYAPFNLQQLLVSGCPPGHDSSPLSAFQLCPCLPHGDQLFFQSDVLSCH